MVEGLLAFGLHHPDAVPRRCLPVLRQLHLATEMHMPQFDAACARWDPALTYTLRPPGCTIDGPEFHVRYDVNAMGVRDGADALDAPAIIVLGDSYAMGWGVARERAFPAVLGRRLGVRVLDAGVSSYGTARELGLLARLDRSALRALVVQYCWNDNRENRTWVRGGGRLPTASRAEWERLVSEHASARRYWPGKYVVTLLTMLARGAGPGQAQARPPEVDRAADDFVAVLEGHRGLLVDTPVVVLPLCARARAMAAALRERAATAPAGSVTSRVSVVEAPPHIRDRQRFTLDGHLNAGGHRRVARLVADELRRRGLFEAGEVPASDR